MTRPHVLCVDDEPAHLQVRVELLRQIGCEAIAAQDHRSALRFARKTNIDLCITDYHLKHGKTGQDVARDLRALYPRAALILFTGDPEMAASARDSFDAVLIKGQCATSVLVEIIEELCHGAVRRRQNSRPMKTTRKPRMPVVMGHVHQGVAATRR